MFEAGTEVRPRRARLAFWRCEHTLARLTRDIVRLAVVVCRGRLVSPRGRRVWWCAVGGFGVVLGELDGGAVGSGLMEVNT